MKRFFAVLCALLGMVWAGCGSNPPASLEFVEISPPQPRIGDIVTVRFKAVDSRGEPMGGALVNFRLQGDPPPPGITLNPATASSIKGTGIVETQVVASARVSSTVVIAEAEGGKVAVSPPITFAGALPSSRQFTFQCGELALESSGSIHAVIAIDNSRHLMAGQSLFCIAHVGDRNGDGVVGAQVSYLTEAGTIGPTDTSKTDRVGNAKVIYTTTLPFPKEVKPESFSWSPQNDATHTGEYVAPLWMHPYDWVTNPILGTGTQGQEPRRNDPVYELVNGRTRENNPRDNLVSMIAITTGEEAYDDINNNGVYDQGEPFVDTTEPFVDYNDNGTWDSDERYVDTDVNGRWDGKNGFWDASTLIWVQERLLWTALPNRPHDYQGAAPVVRVIQPVTQPVSIAHLSGRSAFSAIYSDPWFNPVARNGDDDGCEAAGSDKVKLITAFNGNGVLLTYPSAIFLNGSLEDAHDPNEVPPPAAFVPPAVFDVDIVCKHTTSPLNPAEVDVFITRITGTVE